MWNRTSGMEPLPRMLTSWCRQGCILLVVVGIATSFAILWDYTDYLIPLPESSLLTGWFCWAIVRSIALLDTVRETLLFKVGSTIVMRARKHVYKIYIQNKWDLKEEATSFAIGPQFHILILQINEPYVVALGSNYVVIVWNLQKEKKIYEFFPPPDRCAWICNT